MTDALRSVVGSTPACIQVDTETVASQARIGPSRCDLKRSIEKRLVGGNAQHSRAGEVYAGCVGTGRVEDGLLHLRRGKRSRFDHR